MTGGTRRWGGPGDTCTLVTVATRGPGLGGTSWATSGPKGELGSPGGRRDGGGSRAVKKGVGSTDQILEELVVTPKAADEGEGGPGPGLAGDEDVV